MSRSRRAILSARRCRGRAAPWSGAIRGSRSRTRRATWRTQSADPDSTLGFVRSLIRWRRELGDAPYATLRSEPGVWAYARGAATCVVNLTDEEARHDGRRLGPWETLLY